MSNKKGSYVQCRLQVVGTPTYKIAWIPKKFAKVNNILVDKAGENLLVCSTAPGIQLEHQDILDIQVAYKYQRKNSDI